MRVNVDVLMDRTPVAAEQAARTAIAGIEPPVDLRRLRLRAGGRTALRGRRDRRLAGRRDRPGARGGRPGRGRRPRGAAGERRGRPRRAARGRRAARARAGRRARRPARAGGAQRDACSTSAARTELSLHLKLPGELPLEEAHAVAEEVERAIRAAVPEVAAVHTHIEPLGEAERRHARSRRTRRPSSGSCARRPVPPPRALRFLRTDDGLVAHLTLGLESAESLRGRPPAARARSSSASTTSCRRSPTS